MANDFSTTIFSLPFTAFPVSSTGGAAAFDLWSVKASSLGRVSLEGIDIGQLSSAVASNQQINVQVYRGTTALAGGATVTPVQLKGWPTAPTALSSATAPSSSLASTASATLIIADNSDYSGSYSWRPQTYEEITLDASQALNVRVSAPPITAVLSGTLTFRELGRQK
jgi:hypothetical protein